MVNRYFNPVAYEGELYAPPIDYIEKSLKQLQETYDTNFAAADKLKDSYLESLPKDRARADEFQNDIIKSIDDITAKYSGDYSQATKDLYALQSDIKRKLRPGTEYYTIGKNFQIYSEALKNEQARLAKGEISEHQYRALVANIDKTYTGVKADPTTGTYNTIRVSPLAKYMDSNAIATKALDSLKPREITQTKVVKGPDGYYTTLKETTVGIDPQEAYNAMKAALTNDDQFIAYWQQFNDLQGSDAETEMSNVLNDYAHNLVPSKSGIFKQSNDIDMKEDIVARDARAYHRAVSLENLRLRNRMHFEDYKNKADAPIDGGDLEILGQSNTGFSRYRKIEPATGFFSTNQVNVDQLLKTRSRNDINYKQLEAIRAANPNKSSRDIIELYNNSLSSDKYGSEIYYTRYKTTAAQNEEAQRTVPTLLNANSPIIEYDLATGAITHLLKASDREAAIKKMYDKADKPTKITAKGLGKTSPSSGHLPFGTILAPQNFEGKYYIVPDQSTKFNEFNTGFSDDPTQSRRYKMFGWMQETTEGPMFEHYVEGQREPYKLMGVKEYFWNPQAKRTEEDVRYYGAKPIRMADGSITWTPDKNDPLMENGQFVTPFELERKEIPASAIYARSPRKPRSASSESDVSLETF
jgi:hypothetical protein